MTGQPPTQPPVVRLEGVSLHYGKVVALDGVTLDVPAGCMVGFIGPDGVGKSSLLSLISGARAVQVGQVYALGGSMREKRHRNLVCPRIAYMPQGLGKNLYATLSVEENLQFFARLFGHNFAERRRRIDDLTKSTGLYPFLDRPVSQLSGGMKQKLGLCCALIHDPELLILDEPTTGVDPLARSQFWELIARIRKEQPGMSVIVATAYMDEAERFDWLVAMDAGKILATGSPAQLLERTGAHSLEAAFIQLLPEEKRRGYVPVEIIPLHLSGKEIIAIEAKNLTKRFGNFVAVDHVNFRIQQGEIFGFLGSNGCGKTTTMKMLTGLLPATEGKAWIFGEEVNPKDINTRRRVGYMSQSFSLYSELTVRQNLVLHARLFHVPEADIPARVLEMLQRFGLESEQDSLPDNLPLGVRQRLSLAVAMVHKPELLILDEPTSGVDPIARDTFWRLMIELSRRDHVTIFISTHFMNEAERCDRISLMHAGKVLASGTPAALVAERGAKNLEQAFIGYLLDAGAGATTTAATPKPDAGAGATATAAPLKPDAGAGATATVAALKPVAGGGATATVAAPKPDAGAGSIDTVAGPEASGVSEVPGANPKVVGNQQHYFSMQRAMSYMWRESLELRRDPVRATLALLGSLILMIVMGYGISMDVENLSYAVLDRDDTGLSRNYALNLSGSRYFVEKAPLRDYEELDRRMRSGELSLAVELPPSFGLNLQRGAPVEIGVWIDGAMPQRAETIRGYVQGMHQGWLLQQADQRLGEVFAALITVETRFRYNPDVKSLPAMVPAVIPILLLMLPAMLAALSVVREKELGSILNLYVTPVTRSEFIIGKQIPYVLLAMLNFLLMVLLAVTLFDVPVKGSFFTLCLAAFVYSISATGMGFLASTFTHSQIAALFFTMVGTLMPAIQFSGMVNSVSSLQGVGRFIGEIYPTTHMLIISRGVFNKALGFMDVWGAFAALLLSVPVLLGATILLLKEQES